MSRQDPDRWLRWGLTAAALVAAVLVLLIAVFVAKESLPALHSVGIDRFFLDDGWRPASGTDGRFNLFPMVVGTGLLALGSLSLALPLGLLSAIFCRFYAPTAVATAYRRLIEVLAGVPSVVYGFWGLVTLVPRIHDVQPPGQSLLAGVLILTLMILPTVALMSEAALRSLPRTYFEGAAALGLGRWSTVHRIALPAAASGIASGGLLALARAVGETMAVLMVCGNVVQVPDSVFEPVRALTANIALEMSYATSHHRSALFVSGLVLMVMVGGMVWVMARLEEKTRLA